MPTLVLPRHVLQRPLWPFGINWNTWEAQGLRYWLPVMPSQYGLLEMVSQTNPLISATFTNSSFQLGPPRVPIGFMGQGYRFSAPLELTNKGNVDLGGISGNITISQWCLQLVATAATQRFFLGSDLGSLFSGVFLNSTQHWQASRTWTAAKSRTANEVITVGKLYHVVMTDDGSTTGANMHLYVNGLECGYSATSNATGPATSTLPLDLVLAGRLLGGGQAFTGAITDVRVYNYQMTDAEVQRLYSRAPNFDLYYVPNRLVFSTSRAGHQQFLPLLGVA